MFDILVHDDGDDENDDGDEDNGGDDDDKLPPFWGSTKYKGKNTLHLQPYRLFGLLHRDPK